MVIIAKSGYWKIFSELAAMTVEFGNLWDAVRHYGEDDRRPYDHGDESHWRAAATFYRARRREAHENQNRNEHEDAQPWRNTTQTESESVAGVEEVYLEHHRGVALGTAVRDVLWPWLIEHIFLPCFFKFCRLWDLTHKGIIIPRAGNKSSKNLES